LLGGFQKSPARPSDPGHDSADGAEGGEKAHHRRQKTDVELVEELLKRLHEAGREADVGGGNDGGHGQGPEQKKQEDDRRSQKQGFRELAGRVFQLGGVHGVHFHSGEQQDDAGQKGDAAKTGDMREKAGVRAQMGACRGGCGLEKGNGVALVHP